MIIYVDIEGTICSNEDKIKDLNIDKTQYYKKSIPNHNRIAMVNSLHEKGHTIVYWTARGSVSKIDYTDLTKKQLREWGCKYDDLVIGNKPHFDLYICDKSYNSESFFSLLEKINDSQ